MIQGSIVPGLPEGVLSLVQEGLLERAFHDGLYPALQYRAEAMFQKFEGNLGTEILMTRPGLLRPKTTPLVAGQDPQPQALTYEQWYGRVDQYGDAIDTHMPSSAVAIADLFSRNIHQLGLQAGQSINRMSRNALFKPYLSGSTNLIAATGSGDTTIRVASLNGFTSVIGGSASQVRPVPISSSSPLSITIMNGATPIVRNAIGFLADDASDPYGPGTLTLSATVGSVVATRAPVLSALRPKILRSGGGDSVDALSSADTFTLQDVINAASELRKRNVPPHEDGFYHAHISSHSNAQVFQDPVYQRLNQSLPEHVTYKQGFIGTIAGVAFYMNTESPDSTNVGTLTATSASSLYGAEIGAEVVNKDGVPVGRILVTGKACLYELGLDESAYVSEAGVNGKIGEFDVVNNGVQVSTERVRLIIRAPINRMQDVVSCAWSITAGWPAPTDFTGPGGSELYKRAIIIEHALG